MRSSVFPFVFADDGVENMGRSIADLLIPVSITTSISNPI